MFQIKDGEILGKTVKVYGLFGGYKLTGIVVGLVKRPFHLRARVKCGMGWYYSIPLSRCQEVIGNHTF